MITEAVAITRSVKRSYKNIEGYVQKTLRARGEKEKKRESITYEINNIYKQVILSIPLRIEFLVIIY